MKWIKEKCRDEARKYLKLKDFRELSKQAYKAAIRNNWINEFTWLKRIDPWTKEKCIEEAKKYTILKDFRELSRQAYKAAIKNNWIDEFTWLKRLDHQVKWTKEKCIEEAKKYLKLKDFRELSKQAHDVASRNNWIDEFTWLKRLDDQVWTKEKCIEEAKKYTILKDFRELSWQAYKAAIKNSWIDEFTWLKRNLKRNSSIWTEDTVRREALKYKTIKDFRTNSPNAYKISKKNKWDFPWLSKSVYDINEPLWLVYVYEILDTYVYIGLTIDIKRRDYEHRVRYDIDSLAKFCKEKGIVLEKDSYIIKKEGLIASEAQELEDSLKQEYSSLGKWVIINSGKTGVGTGSLGSGVQKWNKEACIEAAKTCRYKNEFRKKYSRAYNVSRKNGWFDEFTWLTNPPKKKPKSTPVLQYDMNGDFIQEFSCSTAAAESINMSRSAVRKACTGRSKTSGGYIWKYKKGV